MRASRHYDHDILIAEYTLGLLTPQETAHVHTLMANDSAAAVTALNWESSFLKLVDALEPVPPSTHVLKQIQTALGHSPSPPSGRLLRPAAPDIQVPDATSEPARLADKKKAEAKQRIEPSIIGGKQTVEVDAAGNSAPTSTPAGDARSESRVFTNEVPSGQREEATPTAPEHAPIRPQASGAGGGNLSNQGGAAIGAASISIDNQAGDSPKASEHMAAASTVENVQNSIRNGLSALWNAPVIWRTLVVLLAIGCTALALKPDPPLIHITEIAPTHAAVLSAPGTSSTPGWVLTIDTANKVLLTPQVSTEIGGQNAVQLWTQNAQDSSPRSLGLIDANRPVIIKANDIGVVQPSQLFEMTLEAQGGSPTGQPTGPVLFIGRVVLFGSPEPTVHDATSTGAAS